MSTLKMSRIICMAEIVLINKYHLIVSHLVMLLHSLGFNILTIFNNISTIFATQAITTCGAFSQRHNLYAALLPDKKTLHHLIVSHLLMLLHSLGFNLRDLPLHIFVLALGGETFRLR